MRNNTNLFITGCALIMLLLVTISASYAYFNSKFNNNGTLNINTTTSEAATFTAYTLDQIEFNVTEDDLKEPSLTAVKNDAGQVVAVLSSPVEGKTVHCTYDIEFIWDTENQYTVPSMIFNNEYKYEISLQGSQSVTGDTTGHNYNNNLLRETNLTDFTWTGTAGSIGRRSKIISGAEIYSKSASQTKATWSFTLKFYSISADQSNLMGKSYGAHLAVTNVVC